MGFGIMFIMMLFSIFYAVWQLRSVSQNMELVYNHPYKVSNAIRDIQIDMYKTQHLVMDIKYTATKNQLDSLIVEIANNNRFYNENLNLIKSLYLGNKSDVDSIFDAFSDWENTINKLCRLQREKKTDSLDFIIKYENHSKVKHIIYHTKIISDFASNKAETSINQAIVDKKNTYVILIGAIFIVSLLVFVLSYIISKSINTPIKNFLVEADMIFALHIEKPDLKSYNEEELFKFTIKELRQSYQNIEQQNEEIKSNNEQLSNFNKKLEEKVIERTAELKESQERYGITLGALNDGLWDWNVKTGNAFFSPQYYSLLEYENEEFAANYSSWRLLVHPDDLTLVENKLQQSIENSEGFTIDLRMKLKSGKWRWVCTRGRVIEHDAGGKAQRMVGTLSDITERKQAEELLKTNERLLKESQLIAGLGSYVLDLETGLWTSSDVLDSIFGIDKNYLRSIQNWVSIIHPDWKETMNKYFADEVIGKRSRFDKDYKIVRINNNEECWVHGLGELEFNEKGEPLKMLGTIMDITERKEAELLLMETNRNLEEMVYIASHDLQVPLVSMEGYASELLEKYIDKLDEEGKYCLTRLQSNARRMHTLVLSLLDISRLNTKKNPYQKFNLNTIIEKIIQDITITIEKQHATINVGKLPDLFADKIRIESVFRNLIINALNYGGKFISLEYTNNILIVKDNGIGLPESQLERIFNAGERLKKNNAEGVGMGLTFCRKVIEQHKGKIWAESEGENKGTTIYIKLP